MVKKRKLFLRIIWSSSSSRSSKKFWKWQQENSEKIELNRSQAEKFHFWRQRVTHREHSSNKKNEKGRWCLRFFERILRAIRNPRFQNVVEQKKQKQKPHHRHMWTFSWFVLINLWTVVRLFFLSVSQFSCFFPSSLFFVNLLSSDDRYWFNKEQQGKSSGRPTDVFYFIVCSAFSIGNFSNINSKCCGQ